ncbi:MAG TPA: lasso RiPP family leader peptide-containing protein [Tepidisphaeraceae bacterium]|nr:lasso RiPP family leader peptide-containing protein [Tepidisphaeraceae bacterium]
MKEARKEAEQSASRKPYARPQLVKHGNVEVSTQGQTGSHVVYG